MLIALVCGGCADEDSGITTDMHEDFDHKHKHQHTGDDDHEHDHKDGFKGSHAHGHSHSHRHGEPLHGGRIVSIGHTHHKDGATHFHAEVMPLTGNFIRFHVLTESSNGESKDFPVEDAEIPGLISKKGGEEGALECSFVATENGENGSEFVLEIPQPLRDENAFSVVVPKITLDGNRQNFSFSVTRKSPANTAESTDATDMTQEPSDE